MPSDPETLPHTGPAGPAPSMPLDELDIRVDDDVSGGEFVRRLWWRVTVPVPEDPLLHTLIAVYVTDVYMIDPALQVHGHSMRPAATAAAPPTRRSGFTGRCAPTSGICWSPAHRRLRAAAASSPRA